MDRRRREYRNEEIVRNRDTIKYVALKSLSVSSSSSSARQMYPEFDPATFHYAVECGGEDTVRVNAAAKDQNARMTIDGSEESQLILTGLTLYSDIVIEVEGVQHYVVIHCFPSDFLYLTIVNKKGEGKKVSDGLILIAFTDSVFSKTYLTMLDNNGVPRFLRKINSFGDNFRPQINGKYSYTRAEVPAGNPLAATSINHVVLGANLKEEQSGITTVDLSTTGFHEFLITENGNYLVMAYNHSERDMSPYR